MRRRRRSRKGSASAAADSASGVEPSCEGCIARARRGRSARRRWACAHLRTAAGQTAATTKWSELVPLVGGGFDGGLEGGQQGLAGIVVQIDVRLEAELASLALGGEGDEFGVGGLGDSVDFVGDLDFVSEERLSDGLLVGSRRAVEEDGHRAVGLQVVDDLAQAATTGRRRHAEPGSLVLDGLVERRVAEVVDEHHRRPDAVSERAAEHVPVAEVDHGEEDGQPLVPVLELAPVVVPDGTVSVDGS